MSDCLTPVMIICHSGFIEKEEKEDQKKERWHHVIKPGQKPL